MYRLIRIIFVPPTMDEMGVPRIFRVTLLQKAIEMAYMLGVADALAVGFGCGVVLGAVAAFMMANRGVR